MRFTFIERLCDKTVMVRPGESREHKRSVAMDKILTGKYTALPCFIGIMARCSGDLRGHRCGAV